MNLNYCLQPDLARQLPLNSIERNVASLFLRRYWHIIYDHCPKILSLSKNDGKDILEGFLYWAYSYGCTVDWSVLVHLLTYLETLEPYKQKVNEKLIKELMVGTAIKWCITNHASLDQKDIFITHPGLNQKLVHGKKGYKLDSELSISLLKVENLFTFPNKAMFSYALNEKDIYWQCFPD